MTEETVKKRGWVKNVAIIFLAVLLVLTFFSNTIRNRMLPEVASQYVQSGSITSRIRGSATVSAAEVYEVKILENRQVKTVCVKVGQSVVSGDVLFILKEGESEELETARDTLDDLELAYQKAVLSATQADYTRENRDIQKLQEQIAEATAERDELTVDEAAYTAAKQAVTSAETSKDALTASQDAEQLKVDAAQEVVDDATAEVAKAEKALEGLSAGSDDSSAADYAYAQWQAAKETLSEAEDDLEAAEDKLDAIEAKTSPAWVAYDSAMLIHGTYYNELKDAAIVKLTEKLEHEPSEEELENYLADFLAVEAEAYKPGVDEDEDPHYTAYLVITEKLENVADEKSAAEAAVAAAEKAVAAAKKAAAAAKATYLSEEEATEASPGYSKAKKALTAAEEVLTAAEDKLAGLKKQLAAADKAVAAADKTLTAAKDKLAELDSQKTEYKTAADSVKTLINSLEDAVFELAQTQKADNTSAALQALDLQEMRDGIAKQKASIEEMETGSAAAEIKAEVDGVVKSLGVTSGNTTEYNQTLAEIEVTDRGYSAEMTVTTDQAKKVTVGDFADVTTGWWGSSDINARLAAIRTDPQNPQTNRILVFEVTGADVESGSTLSLALGEKSRNYDVIVPNSAIRSDSNGSFVFIVVAKSGPLGNRFTARRVDVQVQAEDDTFSAVTGGVAYGDYVITTSTAPLENGMLVRMAET